MLCLCSTDWKYDYIWFKYNMFETAMTSHGHVTRASLKQANKEDIERHFLSACIAESPGHPSLKLHTVNWGTLNSMMWKFDHDQTNSHRVINKSFGVEECWSYINSSFCMPTPSDGSFQVKFLSWKDRGLVVTTKYTYGCGYRGKLM